MKIVSEESQQWRNVKEKLTMKKKYHQRAAS